MSEWQPIETAPKDGSEVLVGWLAKPGRHKGWISRVRKWREDIGWKQDVWRVYETEPTQWMPLPEPPSTVLSGGGEPNHGNNAGVKEVSKVNTDDKK